MRNIHFTRYIFILIFLQGINHLAFGQSCCSGGVPISNNLGLPATESGVLQLNLSYDLNVLKTLREGTEIIDDRTRERKTHTSLLSLGYSISNRFSVDALLPYIRQERRVENNGTVDFVQSQGIGDAVFLLKYQLFNHNNNQTVLHAGLGTKLPTGRADLRDRNGILLNPEMQAGSGAWDGLLWMQFIRSTNFRPSLSVAATTTYSQKGIHDSYHFGNEFQANLAFSDRLFIKKRLLDPGLTFRYRQTAPDERATSEIVSTGGKWLFISPSITFWIKPEMNVAINTDLPLYANLEGTQFTPTYRFNVSFYYKISIKKNTGFDPL